MTVLARIAPLVCLAALGVLLARPGRAQAPEPAGGGTEPSAEVEAAPVPRVLEEITVTGERSLAQLQLDVGKATEEFWALVSSKLGDPQYAVRCASEARLGTLIKQRVCRTAYQEEELEKSAYAYYVMGGLYNPYILTKRKNQEFVGKIVAAVNSSPELQAAVAELERRKAAYDAAVEQDNADRRSRRAERPAKD
jgi:hypothetical protein